MCYRTGTLNGQAGPGYGGLNWSDNWGVMNTPNYGTVSGYHNGVVSGTNILYNSGAQTVSINSGAFDWNGAFFTGAWNNGLSIQAIGYIGGVEAFNQTIIVGTSGPSWFDANFIGIDSLTISSFGGTDDPQYAGGGQHFAMDNFTLNASVPEASALILLSFGLLGLGVARRRA